MKKSILNKMFAKMVILSQNAYIRRYAFEKECGQVWMFHLVSEKQTESYEKEFTISSENFVHLMSEAKRRGYRFQPLEEIENASTNSIFVTFDDGFREVFTIAYPVLEKLKIPFCVFATTEFLGKTGYLSREELKVLNSSDLCTVGAHSITHPKLRLLDRHTADEEIQQSKLWLENLLGDEVGYFAYPYGDFFSVSNRNKKSVKKSGYKYAFSTIQMPLNKKVIKKAAFIPRKNVNDDNYKDLLNIEVL